LLRERRLPSMIRSLESTPGPHPQIASCAP
jgi:hypothetical protein